MAPSGALDAGVAAAEGAYPAPVPAARDANRSRRPVVLVLGPHLGALSGVSSHLNTLFASQLVEEFDLVHFQVGSEGRTESGIDRLVRLLVSPLALAIAIRARGASIVHLNTSLNFRAFWRDLAYLIVAKLSGARVLYQVHGGALPQEFFAGSRILTALLRAVLRLADAIVVLAQSELRAYCDFVPRQHVVAVPNAIDFAPYAPLARARSAAQGPLRLVYVGRLAKEKGLYELLQGIKCARALGAEPQLTIAGSGPEEGRLREFAAALGLARDVAFIGPVFGADKMRLFAAADVFVLASYSEGLPYALLEGMAAGAPAVTTRVGAIPDVVVEGLHGLLVPPRNAAAIARAIAKLASDRELLTRMSVACRMRIAATYSIERLSGELCGLYQELCATGRRAPAQPGT